MSIRKHPETGIWQIDIHVKGVPRLQRSADTKDRAAAKELHDRLRADLWRQKNVGARPTKTWDELTILWLERCEKKGKRSISDDRDKLRWFLPHFTGKTLTQLIERQVMPDGIERTPIEVALERRAEEPKRTRINKEGELPSPTTINRYATLVTSMLNHARKLGWIDTVPKLEPNPEAEDTGLWITQEAAARLIEELPPHLAAMASFSFATGIRQHNCTHLQWRSVDVQRRIAWVDASDAKGKRVIRIQLNDTALDVLRGQKGKHPRWVFPFQHRNIQGTLIGVPKPIVQPNGEAWEKAKHRAGIDPAFRWHDIRHTWATWHVQNGTPLEVLQKLGGWSDYRMVLKYAKFAPDHIAQYASNADFVARKPAAQTPLEVIK